MFIAIWIEQPGDGLALCQIAGMWLDAGEVEAVSHEERPGLLTRVLSDAFSSLSHSRRKSS